MHRSLALFLLTASAHAVTVRGRVTTPLGVPLPNSRVQLIQSNAAGTHSVGVAISGPDGSYEIQASLAGRFVLLTARSPLIQVGTPFYAGVLDQVTQDIALSPAEVIPAPAASLPTRPFLLDPPQLLPYLSLLPPLRTLPGAFVLQQGPTGAPASLLVEGAAPALTQLRLDNTSVEDLGGSFNLATLSTSGLSAPTSSPAVVLTPAPALPDAEAATLALATPLAETLHPVLIYTGTAAPLDTWSNEAVATLTRTRADLLASFLRFDTANEGTPFHIATTALNAGYHISANTLLRTTFRNDTSASALAPFFNIFRNGQQKDQNTYASATFSTATAGLWSNTLRYGLVRKRSESYLYTQTATQSVTVQGTTALVTLPTLPPRQDDATNRDEATYTTAYPYRHWLATLLTLRYGNERALNTTPDYRNVLTRTHFTAAPALSGSIRQRVFYQASATLDRSPVYGFNAAPQLGLTYAAVQPGPRRFHGSVLRATAATGFREPSLLEAIQAPATPRSRNFTLAADQQILPTLTLTATWFHHQFSHDYEPRIQQSAVTSPVFSPTLAYRTQGVTFDLRYHPFPRVRLTAAYTYLASLVEQSQSTGFLSAALNTRPYHRPPHTASAAAEYAGSRLTAGLSLALASHADASTTLAALPLPAAALDPAQASLNADAAYILTRRITLTTTLTNLLDSRSLAPIGYTSTPFLIRTGLRIRIGHE